MQPCLVLNASSSLCFRAASSRSFRARCWSSVMPVRAALATMKDALTAVSLFARKSAGANCSLPLTPPGACCAAARCAETCWTTTASGGLTAGAADAEGAAASCSWCVGASPAAAHSTSRRYLPTVEVR